MGMIAVKRSAILLAVIVAACAPAKRQPIPGKYEFHNGPAARLQLFNKGTYRLCVKAEPCGTGIYDIEAPRAFPDGTYRLCNSDGCGMSMTKEELAKIEDVATRIYFDPGRNGPMKKFLYPPDGKIVNGRGEDITNQGSEESSLEYGWDGQPGFTFTDPDSGEYFWRVSD